MSRFFIVKKKDKKTKIYFPTGLAKGWLVETLSIFFPASMFFLTFLTERKAPANR